MRKPVVRACQICHKQDADHEPVWMFQPLGPGEAASFTALGYQYRGYPAFRICDPCKRDVQAGVKVTLRYKGQTYIVNGSRLDLDASLYLVRVAGTLDAGGTHIMIEDTSDPDWDVVMCGFTIRQHEQERVNTVNSVTVGDICIACLRSVVEVHDFGVQDRKRHTARQA